MSKFKNRVGNKLFYSNNKYDIYLYKYIVSCVSLWEFLELDIFLIRDAQFYSHGSNSE